MRIKILTIIAILVSLPVLALAAETGFNEIAVSCDGVTTTGACSAFNVHPPDYVHIPSVESFTWQVTISGGTATSLTVTLQGSMDSSTWTTLDTSTNTSGELRSKASAAVKFFRCNVGTYSRNGTNLTCTIMPTQSTGAVSSSSGLTLLEEHTADNSSTEMDFTNCFSSTYDSYQLDVRGLTPATDNVAIRIQLDNGSGYDTGANYSWSVQYNSADLAISGATRVVSDVGWGFGTDISNSATYPGVNGTVYLGMVNSSTQYKIGTYLLNYANTNPGIFEIAGAYVYKATPHALAKFRLLSSSGNLKTGTVACFGIQK